MRKAATSAGTNRGIFTMEPMSRVPARRCRRNSASGKASRAVPKALPMPTLAENRKESRNCRSNSAAQNSQVKPGSRPNASTPTLCRAVMASATARNRKMNPAPGRTSRKMVSRGARMSADHPDARGVKAEGYRVAFLGPQVVVDLSAQAVAVHVERELRDVAAKDD